jgi:hypothetical protein
MTALPVKSLPAVQPQCPGRLKMGMLNTLMKGSLPSTVHVHQGWLSVQGGFHAVHSAQCTVTTMCCRDH